MTGSALLTSLTLAASLYGQASDAVSTPNAWNPTRQTQPIVGGELVKSGTWLPVVGIITPTQACTGTLVEPDLVLTAAHCLVQSLESGVPLDPIMLEVVVGDDIYEPDERTAVSEVGVHPDFCGVGCDIEIRDFAYLTLETPITFSEGIEYPQPITDQDELDEVLVEGSEVILVGYGLDDDSLAGYKREVETEITQFSENGLEFLAGGDGKDSCQGDSGGPAFVTLADGTLRLAGITSRGYAMCGKGGLYTVPTGELVWLKDESGVDLLPKGCPDGQCLDLDPDRLEDEKKCSVAPHRSGLGGADLGIAALCLGIGLTRRRRQDRRKDR